MLAALWPQEWVWVYFLQWPHILIQRMPSDHYTMTVDSEGRLALGAEKLIRKRKSMFRFLQ
eukprot:4133289-Amphidinium_carterae.1